MPGTTKSTKSAKGREAGGTGWTDEEIAAAKEHTQELKAARSGKSDGEADVLAKIAEMPGPDRAMAERIHAIVKDSAPQLASRTWYGMPAYTLDGKVVCFFKAASKFNGRYATFGFEEAANLDDASMWATSWAITELTPADEAKLASLVKQAASR